ncbi:ABC transporter substrate-binding protein [Oceanispirochaeta sp.]|uniref:ABC transporter substrate-binding protein n=1 Tax=Oceanispirochaeta sp. TaxID=2035350 RepID=UPI002630FC9E|nr:ABC transporter substrate-binding protein [Oceanispirochaeta sp.]MDA3958602.1 ABC transporter substrate-binding protein [Oceanispirochaeta sp.]
MKKGFYLMLILSLVTGMSLFAAGQKEVKTDDKKAAAAVVDVNQVEVLHWWTSGGEAAALNVLKKDLESKGIGWTDSPVAGGGGDQAMTVLRSRATAGNPPVAVQMLGFDIIDWANLGFLADLNDVARDENWDSVVPEALKFFSKQKGQWVAAPVNVHSTNWVWANKKIMDDLGIKEPKTWDEYMAAMEKVKAAGFTALAHGGQAWQDGTVFESVVIATGGPEFYKKTMIDLDEAALKSDKMVEVFNRMAKLRTYVDPNFSGRDWNLASAMVIEGTAAFQMMGDWAKGEFKNAGLEPGKDFYFFRTPGTQGTVTFNSDQFVMFKVAPEYKHAQQELAKAIMNPSFQIAFNLVKGSVPARTDISDAEFDAAGKKGMKDLADAAKNGTLFGSMAHGHAVPAGIKQAMFDVITAHFNGVYDAKTAAQELAKAVAAAK